MPLGQLNPNIALAPDRFINSQTPGGYDPNNIMDPIQGYLMQQEYLRQMFQMQNPRLTLPQQFGQALGNFAQKAGQQAGLFPQPPPQQQQQQGPKSPVGQDIEMMKQRYMQKGMDPGEALYRASADVEASGMYDSDPTAQQVFEHTQQFATDKLKFNPQEAAKMKQEKDLKSAENFVATDTGQRIMAKPGTPLYDTITSQPDKWTRASDIPQQAAYTVHEYKKNGMFMTEMIGPDGKPVHTFSSTAPIQATAALDADNAARFAKGGTSAIMTNDANDKMVADLSHRSAATQNALEGIDHFIDMVKQNPAAVGKSGDILDKVNDHIATIHSLADTVTGQPRDYSQISPAAAGLIDRLRNTGVDAAKINSVVTDLAYTIEATQGNTNTDPAARQSRIEQIKKEILGDKSSDPAAVVGSATELRNTLVRKLNNDYAQTPVNVKADKPQFLKDEMDKLQGRPPGPDADLPPQAANWDDAKKARFRAYIQAHK